MFKWLAICFTISLVTSALVTAIAGPTVGTIIGLVVSGGYMLYPTKQKVLAQMDIYLWLHKHFGKYLQKRLGE